MAKNPAFEALLEEIKDLHNRKNANYAGKDDPYANFRRCEAIGIPAWMGIIVRMEDKMSRIENLAGGVPDMVGESLIDTLVDLGVYSLLCSLVLKERLEVLKQPGHTCFRSEALA